MANEDLDREDMRDIAEEVLNDKLRTIGIVINNGEIPKLQADMRFLRTVRVHVMKLVVAVAGVLAAVLGSRVPEWFRLLSP